MKSLNLLPLLLAALACAAPLPVLATVVPGVPSAETEVAGVLGRWDRARAQHDPRVLAEVMAKDFVATWAEGARLTRSDILAGKAPEKGARLIYRDEIDIQVAGDRASARTRVVRVGTAGGADRGEITRETVVLRRSRGAWLLVASRSDPAAPEDPKETV
jgi:hypothetical protein